jgi:CrcB protein
VRLPPIALVALGGAAGAIARWALGLAIDRKLGTAWPWGTFVINVSGCFVIGLFLTLVSQKVIVNDSWRYLVPVGFVGAYTTFSTYEYETWRLIQLGHAGRAALYVAGSSVAGFAAVWLAALVAKRFG